MKADLGILERVSSLTRSKASIELMLDLDRIMDIDEEQKEIALQMIPKKHNQKKG